MHKLYFSSFLQKICNFPIFRRNVSILWQFLMAFIGFLALLLIQCELAYISFRLECFCFISFKEIQLFSLYLLC